MASTEQFELVPIKVVFMQSIIKGACSVFMVTLVKTRQPPLFLMVCEKRSISRAVSSEVSLVA